MMGLLPSTLPSKSFASSETSAGRRTVLGHRVLLAWVPLVKKSRVSPMQDALLVSLRFGQSDPSLSVLGTATASQRRDPHGV
jgi:hypothetical protein